MKERAKEIYRKYLGNKYQMMRDGLIEEYESYNVPSELENRWRAEIIKKWEEKLSSEDIKPITMLSIMRATEALPKLIKMAVKGDSYYRLMVANALWRIATGGDRSLTDKSTIILSKAVAVSIWKEIVRGDIHLDKEPNLKAWPNLTTEEALQAWAHDMLEKAGEANT